MASNLFRSFLCLGGFSNITSTAWFQTSAVSQYLKSGKTRKIAPKIYFRSVGVAFPPMNVWNKGGRAYPDAVACGHNLMVVLNGKPTQKPKKKIVICRFSAKGRLIPVDGTSASAPIFAGVITLLNDQRARVGKKPLGFINPLVCDFFLFQPMVHVY